MNPAILLLFFTGHVLGNETLSTILTSTSSEYLETSTLIATSTEYTSTSVILVSYSGTSVPSLDSNWINKNLQTTLKTSTISSSSTPSTSSTKASSTSTNSFSATSGTKSFSSLFSSSSSKSFSSTSSSLSSKTTSSITSSTGKTTSSTTSSTSSTIKKITLKTTSSSSTKTSTLATSSKSTIKTSSSTSTHILKTTIAKVVSLTTTVAPSTTKNSTPTSTPKSITSTPSAPKPSSESSASTSSLSKFQQSILDAHNKVRPSGEALVWDSAIAGHANTWSQHLESIGSMVHSSSSGYGENLYWISTSSVSDEATLANNALQSWYSEKQYYNPSNDVNNQQALHYTQVMWKGSTKLGCAYGAGSKGTYVVCNYASAGNFAGKFTQNVPS